MNTAHVSSTLRLFCIADRYQVSDIRSSILLILAVSRLQTFFGNGFENARKVRVPLSQWFGRVLHVVVRCDAVSTAAAVLLLLVLRPGLHRSSSSYNRPQQQQRCLLLLLLLLLLQYFTLCCCYRFMCGKGNIFCTSAVGSTYSSPYIGGISARVLGTWQLCRQRSAILLPGIVNKIKEVSVLRIMRNRTEQS